jgi:hypothetical protein
MTHYKFSQDELLAFAKKIYEEACYGYMDLKESVCDVLVREFIDGRQIVSPIDTNIMAVPENVVGGYMGHGNTYNGSVVSFTTTNTAMIPGNLSMGSVINVNDIPASGPTWEVNAPQVRTEEYVRPEQNFHGNESERF